MSLFPEVCPPESTPTPALNPALTAGGIQELQVRIGAERTAIHSGAGTVTLDLPMPRLAGPETEWVGRGVSVSGENPGFHLIRQSGRCYGIALGHPDEPPQAAAHRLYAALLKEIPGQHLHRVWNWIPGINDSNAEGEENYRAFNAGRHAAFSEHFGPEALRPHLPAASALGIQGNRMAVLFAAGSTVPENFENPEQVPAWDYPAQYGRRPPSFARGTGAATPAGGREWFLSGTASIKGHQTLGGTFDEQMRLTLDNVRLMRAHMGVPDHASARWKVFLRHAGDLAACQEAFTEAWPQDTATTLYLRADICRACLLVEVEGTFSLPPG